MRLSYSVNPYLPATHRRHLVYTLIEVVAEGDEAPSPAPLNLGLVVDASRSMRIPNLTEDEFTRLVAQGMAHRREVDGVQVWALTVPVGWKPKAPSNTEFVKEALRAVAARLRPQDRFSLVAFAQDALLMVGDTPGDRAQELLRAAERLDEIDLGDETYMARGMALSYRQMAHAISPDRVSRMLVLTDGYTKDMEECFAVTRQAGIAISTIGLGFDFNEELLIAIAEHSGGHAYFIDDPTTIPATFEHELTIAQGITGRDLTLTLITPTDITLRRAHRVRPSIVPLKARGDTLPLGDLEAEGIAVLMEWIVPPRRSGVYRLVRVELHGRMADDPHPRLITAEDLVVRYTEKVTLTRQTNPYLMAAVQRVSAFKLHNQAMQEASRGNIAGATRRLRMAGERLRELGEHELGRTMFTEAERLEREGNLSPAATKKLRYGTRRLR